MAPPSGAERTLRRARKSQGHDEEGLEERHSCQRSPGVWGVYIWAFLCESDSSHHHSMDAE